jgi:hypothetical protein
MKKIFTLSAGYCTRSLASFALIVLSFFLVQFRAGAQTQTWEVQTHPVADIEWHSIAYGTGLNGEKLFVAVARTGTSPNQAMWSPTGLSGTWTLGSSAESRQWFDIQYGYYSASVTNKELTGNVATLTTSAAHNFDVGQTVIVSGVGDPFDGTYLITNVTSNTFSYSKTATNVSSTAVSPVGKASCGVFVAIASNKGGPDPTLNKAMTSKDGKNWTQRTVPNSNAWNSLTYGNDLFVAVASSGGLGDEWVMTSPDGITWTARAHPNQYAWRGVTFGNNTFVAVATDAAGSQAMTSSDGINWTTQTTPTPGGTYYGVVYGQGKFVAVGLGAVMTSPDGVTWTAATLPSGASLLQFNDVAYSPEGRFVAVAQTTSTTTPIMASLDGTTWVMQEAEPNAWRGVIYGDSRFVAVGTRTGAGKEQRHVITTVFNLPLTLISFNVTDKDCQANLEWKTASEVNTSHFEVESSSDGRNFRAIGRVEAQGNGNGRTYGFRAAQVPGRSYYRLKMADLDGKFTYSPVRTLTIGCAGQTQLSIYPNPLTQGSSLSFRLSTGYRGNAKAELVTTEGRIIRTMALSVGLGENNYALPAADLPAGAYTLRVIRETGEPIAEPQRVIKR